MNTQTAQTSVTLIQPGRWVFGSVICQMFGFTAGSLKKCRQNGEFLEGVHYRYISPQRVSYSVEAINNWMEGK